VDDLLGARSHTPLPTILMVAGIFFWILAIAGSLAGKITVEPAKQKTAAVVGTAFIALGLFLIFFTPESERTGTAPPAATPPTASATQPTPSATQPTPPRHTRPSPGVDCTSGTPDELEICGNASLIELDWQLNDIYQALMERLDKDQKTQLTRDESAWVRQRGECQRDDSCLAAAYNSRIKQLQRVQ
jgi:uncharacterized protein YecT (DUF1311 family)